jgi:saccharopine dehydrogenase (NAD+, L-glutamate forming)
MQGLHAAAKRNNLVFMNEIGLDPGIDHMSAIETLMRIRDKGGRMLV